MIDPLETTLAPAKPLSADAQSILESMGDAFYALDGEWRIVYANRRALAFWNVRADDVVGRVIWERFPELVGSLNEQVLRRVRDEQCVVNFEAPSPTTGVWISVNVGPSDDGVTVYWRDISARIEAENALRSFAERLERQVAERTRVLRETIDELRRSRERYSAIFENSPVDLVFMAVQPDGRIVCEEANPAWERHSGYRCDYVTGKSLEEILPREQAEYAYMQYRRAIETRQPVEYEYTARFPIGEVSRRSFLVPLAGDDGRIGHVLLTSVDLTEMRRVEAQLRQAQKMEAIGQLTGGVAHDFNNLLTAVVGNLEMLQRRVTDQRALSHVDGALRSALRGAQLVQQLLAYARRQKLSPRPVDVNAVIVNMGELLQRTLGGLVQVENDLADDVWPAVSDPTQLELVILNLAINSRDAMPTGGRLRIATNNLRLAVPDDSVEAGDYVRIAVTDTGSGMAPAVLDKAFEPFFTTKDVGKGSGLGLAQVYGVATQFGGTARIASSPGVGTTVEVWLPRASPTEEGPMGRDLAPTEAVPGSGTLLVVDDDRDVRDIAAIFLREAGYDVREAASGHEALDVLARGRISLAIVDYAMPMMSGYEFVCAARAVQPDLPVIYVTGAADMVPLGPDPLITKPYTRATLLRLVRDHVLRTSSRLSQR